MIAHCALRTCGSPSCLLVLFQPSSKPKKSKKSKKAKRAAESESTQVEKKQKVTILVAEAGDRKKAAAKERHPGAPLC